MEPPVDVVLHRQGRRGLGEGLGLGRGAGRRGVRPVLGLLEGHGAEKHVDVGLRHDFGLQVDDLLLCTVKGGSLLLFLLTGRSC